jgi:hypothetical protein
VQTLKVWTIICLAAVLVCAQEQPKVNPKAQPQVRVHYLNVCAPSEADQKELTAALARIPTHPRFAPDFEVDRGRTTTPDQPASNWVRIRREFAAGLPFTNAQYTFSVNDNDRGMAEILVVRARESKPGEMLQLSFDNAISAGTPATVLASDTPVERIKVERFGSTSIGLARCPEADQRAYAPLFRIASEIFARYRVALNVRQTVPGDLARVTAAAKGADSAPKKKAAGASIKANSGTPPETKN